jgi:Ser/Thr protein kinase RdoA (MazF antagonist)
MDEYAAVQAWRSVVGAARLAPMDRVSNPLWRVIAEDGREWVLKHLPNFPPGVGPVEEYRVLCYLQGAGLPVAVPVVTDDGLIAFNADNLRTELSQKEPTGEHAYALIPLLPNDSELCEPPELAHTIGAAIGRLDRVLAECPWHVVSFTDDPAPEILGERYPRLPDELRVCTDPLRDRLYSAIVDLPMQRTHGDCNVGNVLVHHGAVSGFIDFDHLPTGPRIRDLSYYLVSRLRAHVDHGDPAALAAVLPDYVAGYRSEYPLTDREFDAVLAMMLTVEIGVAEWHLNGSVSAARYEENRRTIEWISKRYDELVGV